MPENKPELENQHEQRLGYQLRRASVLMMANLERRLSKLGLSPTEAAILTLIKANPSASQTEIGRALAVQRANMTPLIAGLVARGLIARAPADGRSHALLLTPDARTLAAKAETCLQEHEKHFFGALSDRERERLLSQLRDLRAVGD
jgi:DNA-binding MarR family transcriptional regulator